MMIGPKATKVTIIQIKALNKLDLKIKKLIIKATRAKAIPIP
jgi:hypothetical protein